MSKKSNAGFYHDGFAYTCEDATQELVYRQWRCNSPKCPARITTFGFEQFEKEKPDAPHNHSEPKDVFTLMLKWYLIQTQATNKKHDASETVTLALAHLEPDQVRKVATLKQLGRYVSKLNNKMENLGKSAKKLEDLVLTEDQKITIKGLPFLLFEDPIGAKGRSICFATRENLEHLSKCKVWLADSTFSTVSPMFKQLWVIFGKFKGSVIPMVYVLMTSQNTSAYSSVLLKIKEHMDQIREEQEEETPTSKRTYAKSPKGMRTIKAVKTPKKTAASGTKDIEDSGYNFELLVDFEAAQAFQSVFNVTPVGCFFHFRQALNKNKRRLKTLSDFIQADSSFVAKKHFVCFAALALIAPRKLSLVYKAFKESQYMVEHNNVFKDFIEYFENQWIGKVKDRRGWTINKVSWNVYQQAKDGLMKTTCSVESWNSHFQKFVAGKNPPVNGLIKKLQHQQKLAELQVNEEQGHRKQSTPNQAAIAKASRAREALSTPIKEGAEYEHLLNIASALI